MPKGFFKSLDLWNFQDCPLEISVHQMASKLGQQLYCALPSLHALTGCVYTAAFLQKATFVPWTSWESRRLLWMLDQKWWIKEYFTSNFISHWGFCLLILWQTHIDQCQSGYTCFIHAVQYSKKQGQTLEKNHKQWPESATNLQNSAHRKNKVNKLCCRHLEKCR